MPRRARCPSCQGRHTRHNGFSVAGHPRLRCMGCGASWRAGKSYRAPLSMEAAATADLMLQAGKRQCDIARAIEEAEKEVAQDVKDVLDERLRFFATKADIADLESRLTTKLLTCGLGSAGIILGGVYFMLTHFKP